MTIAPSLPQRGTSVSVAAYFGLFAVAIPIAFFFVVTGKFVYFPISWGGSVTGPAALFLLAIISIRLSTLVVHDGNPFMRLPFYVFVYIFFCITPCYQFFVDGKPKYIEANFTYDEYEFGLYIITLSVVMYEIGVYLAGKASIPSHRPGRANAALARIAPTISVALALFSVAAFMVLVRDLNVLLGDRSDFAQPFDDDASPMRYLIAGALVRTPSFAAISLLWSAFLQSTRETRPRGLGAAFLICAPVWLITNLPSSIPRVWLGAMLLDFVVLYTIVRKVNLNMHICLGLLFSMLILFPMANVLRYFSTLEGEVDWYAMVMDSYTDGNFDAFQMMLVVFRYVDVNGLTNGWQSLSALLFWIPREIFPDKAIGTGGHVAAAMGFTFTNVSSPFPAELYIDFGMVGVAVGMIFLGWLMCSIERRANSAASDFGFCLVGAYLAGWQFILLRGALINALSFLLPALLLFGVLGVITARKSKAAPSAARDDCLRRGRVR